jgi:antitoxin component YwqK of YwqJK toxin-antitoxin module
MKRYSKHCAAIAVCLLALPTGAAAEQAGALSQFAAPAVARLSDLQGVDGRQLLDGKPFTGIVLDTYPDGARKARFQLVGGKADGAWTEWHPDGAVRFYSEWQDGKGEGPFVYFHPNGEISERVTARGDRWDGVAEGWHPDGRKAFERTYSAGLLMSEVRLPSDGKE